MSNWSISGSYSPHRVEETVLWFWENEKIYDIVKRENEKNNLFFNFIDGPPYPTGDIPHIGTAFNKSLKDSILRYKRMKRYRVNDRPGYDCHGLPIEVKVEQRLGIRFKREIEEKIGVDRFIEECKRFAISNLNVMTKWFKELGVFMDWNNPYLTFRDEYIESAWWLIKKADERDLLDVEYRVVHWCPRCSTTLAEYEIEYRDIEDPSIYVKFPVREEPNTYLLIWTTTPWTLPANVFVMVHPDEIYAKIRVRDEYWVIAEKRLEHVLSECNIGEYEVVERIVGRDLSRYTYDHPLRDIVPLQEKLVLHHRVIPTSEYVSMNEGTGLVHGAPGHGFEDFDIASRHGLLDLVLCPVDEEGKFTSEAGLFANKYVREANEDIVNALRDRGVLVHSDRITHRYPVCWRCKTPVILRSTRQWVIKVTKLREKLREEAVNVKWIPSWALTRLMNILDTLQDWVISRQRYWGTPLPIWMCPSGHRVVVGSIDELVKLTGERPLDLHRPWIDRVVFNCPRCGLPMKRVPDVMDVWLDSGIAFYASQGYPERLGEEKLTTDFITEGHDQVRGWFFSLLRSGVIGFNRAPYRVVLVHGFMLDEQGREMHKSLGNYVGVDEAIEKTGRDPLRLWLLSNTIWEDMRFSWRGLDEAKRDLSILWNIFVFAKTYMDIDKFDPARYSLGEYVKDLKLEDLWILSRVNSLVKRVEELMESYDIPNATRVVRDFIVEDLSHWYIRIIRPRVWIEENAVEKISAYITLYHVLDKLLRLIAPITPFIAEYLYQAMYREYYKTPSIHLLEFPVSDQSLINPELETHMEIIRDIYTAASSARMKAGLKLRQPVRRLIIYTDNEVVKNTVEYMIDVVKFTCNTKQVEVTESKRVLDITKYRVKPIHRVIGPKYRDLAKRILEYIEVESENIARGILESGVFKTTIEDREIELTREDVEITPYYVEGYLVEDFKHGVVALDTRLTPEEQAEGLARDIVRRIQVMRKKLDLPITARIKTLVIAPSDKISLLHSKREYIMSETRSIEFTVSGSREVAGSLGGYVEEWDIDDEVYVIEVKRVD